MNAPASEPAPTELEQPAVNMVLFQIQSREFSERHEQPSWFKSQP